nr:unnamed protein product [Callosobruchus analis]
MYVDCSDFKRRMPKPKEYKKMYFVIFTNPSPYLVSKLENNRDTRKTLQSLPNPSTGLTRPFRVRMILSKKTELFEQFGPTITKDTRRKAWSEVRDYAVSIGLLTSNRDTTYVRDTTWQNLRGRTMMSDITKEQKLLKKRKLQLEVRKLEIDIWEKENAAGLKHCDLTNHIERASEPTKISEQSATQVVQVAMDAEEEENEENKYD